MTFRSPGLDPIGGSRTLDVAAAALVAACVALFVFHPQLMPYGPHAAVAVGWGALAVGAAGLARYRPQPRSSWALGLAAIGVGSAADTALILAGMPGQYDYPPVLIAYALCYVVGLAGAIRQIRWWPTLRHWLVLIDSATLTVAALTVLASLGMDQLADASIPSSMRLAGFVFPILDTVLVAVLARIWFSQSGPAQAMHLMLLSPLFLIIYHAFVLQHLGDPAAQRLSRWNELWVPMFVTMAVAMTRPSVALVDRSGLAPIEASLGDPQRRRGISVAHLQALSLALGLALPPALLLALGAAGRPLPWVPIGLGGMAMALLVAARVALLVHSVQAQFDVARREARADALTGAANRRQWDEALDDALQQNSSRAGPALQEGEAALWVALLDLDHFKRYNDTHGHAAGDELLRQIVRAWTAALPDGALLARHGGEEFAVLLPRATAAQASAVLDGLRAWMPSGQTCSIGLARCWEGASVDALMREADSAMYTAKEQGRDRMVVAPAKGARSVASAGQPSTLG